MSTVRHDVSYALRGWRRRRGATAAAIAALALGIGATTTIFSIVGGVLLRPLPYEQPDRLVAIWRDMRAKGGPEKEWASPAHVIEWQRLDSIFAGVAGVRGWSPALTGDGEPERLRGAAVSRDYFEALGIEPSLGRTFTADEDAPGAPPVVVIGHALWERRFGGTPDIVGRTIALDGQQTTIVGVMPRDFQPAVVDAEVWTPLRLNPANASRGMIVLRVLGKLRPDVSVTQARDAMAALALQAPAADRQEEGGRISLVPLHEDTVGAVRPVLLMLSAAVLLVLLISCANVASLLLARASERAAEITVRLALGASRRHIVRQLVTESALLAAAGGTLGLLAAWWGLDSLLALAPPSAPRLAEVGLDTTALAFTAGISVGCALLCGLAPAGAVMRRDLSGSLRTSARDPGAGGRLRSTLVVLEVTLAMVLVAGAGLLVRSLVALQRIDLGIDPAHVLTASIAPPRAAYRDEESVRTLTTTILERVAAVPDVEVAALTSVLPLSGMDTDITFEIVGTPRGGPAAAEPAAWFRVVSSGYFAAVGMRILEGRAFTAHDTAGSPGVIIVNAALAREHWPGRSPLGARVRVGPRDATVIGITADVRHRGPGQPAEGEMYFPASQFPSRGGFLVLKTRNDPALLAPAIRAAVRSIDPHLPVANVATMEQLLARTLAQPRFLAGLLTGFAGVAVGLALVGVYSILSFAVSRRVREIGVRMALGAERTSVTRLVLGHSLRLVTGGVALGAALAAVLSRGMRAVLYGVEPGDPTTLIGMAILILAAATAASYAPARRAARIDPAIALRDD